MKRTRVRVEDFTIGWICALPIELSAATVILDEEYDTVFEAAQYVLGRVGVHDVVIACLPAGQYGLTSAAVTASQLLSKFPNVQYWLMVGVGGGVPSFAVDIRLGDVVICKPQNQHGGVIQYDLGKVGLNGEHIRTGSLNSPHPVLGAAVSKMQSMYDVGKSKVQSHLTMFSHLEKFTRCSAESDVLFDPEYHHGKAPTCDECSRQRVVPRAKRFTRDIALHFGLIASGNQVIKDGITRDNLSAALGGVLCFEMEAAGLMNNFPCLVIRGICDYADSHKNKQWQPFAAAAAAACAKEVLACVPSNPNPLFQVSKDMYSAESGQLMGDQRMKPSLSEPNQMSPSENLNLAHGLARTFVDVFITSSQRKEYLESLKFFNINARYGGIRSAHSQTCGWILNTPQYRTWLTDEGALKHHGFFWIKGNPGAGKSTMMKYILETIAKSSPETITITFFFNARGAYLERSTLGMYRSILYQLLHRLPALQNVLAIRQPKLNSEGALEWEIDDLKVVLEHALQQVEKNNVIFLIDALDECDEDEVRDMVASFEHLGQLSAMNNLHVRACFLSRHYPNVIIDNSLQLDLGDQEEHVRDIQKFLQTELKAGQGRFVINMRSEILQRASGIFLWVVLVVQILNAEYARGNKHAMRKRLDHIPNGLELLFEDLLRRDNQSADQFSLCIRSVLFSRTPILDEELYHAVLAGTDPSLIEPWDPEEISLDDIRKFILHNSKGLVDVFKSSHIVHFIHECVQQYFLNSDGLQKSLFGPPEEFEAQSHERLKLVCMEYCMQVDFKKFLDIPEKLPEASSPEALRLGQKARKLFPFLEYAVDYVFEHSEKAENLGLSQKDFILHFPLQRWISLHNLLRRFQIQRLSTKANLLYIFARDNLPNLIKLQYEQVRTIDIKGESYVFPLNAAFVHYNESALWALLNCHLGERTDIPRSELERIIAMLMNEGPPATGDSNMLQWVTRINDIMLWKIFLPHGEVDTNIAELHGKYLLAPACAYGFTEVVKSLLLHKVNPNLSYHTGQTPLSLAAKTCNIEIVKLLLSQGADPDFSPWDDRKPLSYAAEAGSIEIVQLLIQRGADTCAVDMPSTDGPALCYACANGHWDIVELLLAHNTDDSKPRAISKVLPAIAYASANGYIDIVKVLLERNTNTYWQDKCCEEALPYAVLGGYQDLFKLLLSSISDVSLIKFDIARRIYANAGKSLELGIIGLLKLGPDINLTDESGETFLMKAAREGSLMEVTFLLTCGIDAQRLNNAGESALAIATDENVKVVLRSLVRHDDVHNGSFV